MLKRSTQRRRAASPMALRRTGSPSSSAVASTMAPKSSTPTTCPVSPSATMASTPGTEVATTGTALRPASIRTPGIPSPRGRLGNTMMSVPCRTSATSPRAPRSSTPAAWAGVANGPLRGPSPTARARNSRPRARRAATTSTKRSGRFWTVKAPTKLTTGSGRLSASAPGWNSSGSRPLGTSTSRPGGTPRTSRHSSRTSTPSAATRSGLRARYRHMVLRPGRCPGGASVPMA